VGLVDDQRVVLIEKAIMLGFCQQNAVGHQLDQAFRPGLVLEPHLVAHRLPQRLFQFLGDARRHRARGDAARLGVTDNPGQSAPRLQTDLGQLRRLAGTRLAANDDDLMQADGGQNIVLLLRNRQIGIVQRRHACRPRLPVGRRHLQALPQVGQIGGDILAGNESGLDPVQHPAQTVLVPT